MKAALPGVSPPQTRALAVIPKGNCPSALAAVEIFKVTNNSEISKLEWSISWNLGILKCSLLWEQLY